MLAAPRPHVSVVPGSENSPRWVADSVGDGPVSMVGTIEVVRCTASVGLLPASRPTIQFTQPRRTLEVGSASSISSIARKCERFGWSMPTAWTAASSPPL